MKKYEQSEVADKFRAYVSKTFQSGTDAAWHYNTTPQAISNIYAAQQWPNKQMLADMGLSKVKETYCVKAK